MGDAGDARKHDFYDDWATAGRRRRGGRLRLALVVALVADVAVLAGLIAWSTGLLGGDRPASGGHRAAQPAAVASPSPGLSASPVAELTPSPAPTAFTVTAGGDVIGDRGIRTVLAEDRDELFGGIELYFHRSDFGFVNLETPLTYDGEPQTWKDVVFKGAPRLAPVMAAAGIDVVTLANNHAGDQGDEGLLDTIEYTQKHGIALVGAGKDLAAARRPALLKKDGLKVAFLGFTDVLPLGYPATADSPGTSPGRTDLSAVKRAVEQAADKADFVVVGWHWNEEYSTAPRARESSEAKAAIDAGADLVFAHHPHVLQGVEVYHGGLICYSLGDLVFDGVSGATAQTVLVRARVCDDEIDATLIPVQIGSDGVPAVVGGATGADILDRMKSYSAALDTTVKIAHDRGYIHITR